MKLFTSINGETFVCESRWISIKCILVTHRHALSDYADFSYSDIQGELLCFVHEGKQYALGQFLKIYPIFFTNEYGKESYLCAVDCTDYYNPYYIEISDDCEYVRLFRKE